MTSIGLSAKVPTGFGSDLLKKHFEQMLPILQGWSSHSSVNLRRCVVVAMRSAGNLRRKDWFEPLISPLEPLLADKTEYVRKNLGPYAIGDGLFRGTKNWREGLQVVAELAAGERRYVWRAVASALLCLARRNPEVRNALEEWLKDPERIRVAKTTLEHLQTT